VKVVVTLVVASLLQRTYDQQVTVDGSNGERTACHGIGWGNDTKVAPEGEKKRVQDAYIIDRTY
jgi:hypothetical protein